MDEIFSYLTSLPEGMKRAFAAGLIGVMVPLIFGNAKALKPLGKAVAFGEWRPFSPNFITAYSLTISLAGIVLFFLGYPATGICIAGFGAMLDRLDGRMAYVQKATASAPNLWTRKDGVLIVPGTKDDDLHDYIVRDDTPFGRWWFEMNFGGGTDLGKVLDPGADKVKTLVLLILFAWYGFLWWPLVIVHTVPELVGTLMRRPFSLLAHHQKEPKATAIGKWKAVVQWIVVIFCLVFYNGWFTDGITLDQQRWIDNGALGFATLFALMSVASRLKIVRDSSALKETLKSLDSGLDHD